MADLADLAIRLHRQADRYRDTYRQDASNLVREFASWIEHTGREATRILDALEAQQAEEETPHEP